MPVQQGSPPKLIKAVEGDWPFTQYMYTRIHVFKGSDRELTHRKLYLIVSDTFVTELSITNTKRST